MPMRIYYLNSLLILLQDNTGFWFLKNSSINEKRKRNFQFCYIALNHKYLFVIEIAHAYHKRRGFCYYFNFIISYYFL